MANIILFSANYLPNIGGVEKYTQNLSLELASRGHKITIVTSNVFNLTEYEILEKNIEIYRLPCINLLNGRFPVLKFWNKKHRELNKLISSNQYDLTIVNTRFYLHSLYGSILGKKHSKKVIAIEHGSAHLTVNSKFWDFLGHIFEHTITFFLKRNIKDFYGVSSKCNDWLCHFNINAKGTLYNAINPDEIDFIKQDFYSNIINLEENSKVVSFVGRLVYEKGIIQLIDAIKIINTKYNRKDIHLLVAGDGPLYNKCNQMNVKNVHLLGKLDFTEVVKILSLSSIFCFPTFYPEGFPTSILEAAYCKNYIIIPPTAGTKELLLNDSYGTILSESPTPDEIADAIIQIIDDEQKQTLACDQCYTRVLENFTWKKTADTVEKILEN